MTNYVFVVGFSDALSIKYYFIIFKEVLIMSTKYNVGDKVVIVSTRVLGMNYDGGMDKYLGTVMTIRQICNDTGFPYRMVEDQKSIHGTGCWSWSDDMIDHEATAKLRGIATAQIPSNEIDFYVNKTLKMFEQFDSENILLTNAARYTAAGIRANVEEWYKNKAKLMELLRKHPNWNEEAKAVIYLNTEERLPSTDDSREALDRLIDLCDMESNARQRVNCSLDTLSMDEYTDQIVKTSIRSYGYLNTSWKDAWGVFIVTCFAILEQKPMNTMTTEICNIINTFYPDIRCKAGQKSSRVMNKLLTKFGFDKSSEYNRLFAKLADSMNPFKVERITVLSVNFMDYLTMSNGNSWTSCHTIIEVDGDDYSGCHMGGTLSYANDAESLIFYTLDKNYQGTDYYLAPKINRQVFFWDYPVLVQERLYPQCNDGTEQGRELVKQYRNVVETIFAEVMAVPNLWVKENRNKAHIEARPDTYMYHDWSAYTNYIVHIKKEVKTSDNEVEEGGDTERPDGNYVVRSAKYIQVGQTSYCMNCGRAKYEDDYYNSGHGDTGLLCVDCHPDENCRCADCGSYHDRDDMYRIDGEYYCSDCVTYCDYHDQYELASDNLTYIDGYGYVCEDGLEYGNFFYCEQCGQWYWHHNERCTEVEGDTLCESCTESYATQCECCGEYFYTDNMICIDYEYYCEDCAAEMAKNEEESEEETA